MTKITPFFTKKWYPWNIIILVLFILLIVVLIWGGITNWKFVPVPKLVGGDCSSRGPCPRDMISTGNTEPPCCKKLATNNIYTIRTEKIDDTNVIGYNNYLSPAGGSNIGSIKPVKTFLNFRIVSLLSTGNGIGLFLLGQINNQNIFDYLIIYNNNSTDNDYLVKLSSSKANYTQYDKGGSWVWTIPIKWEENTDYKIQFILKQTRSPSPTRSVKKCSSKLNLKLDQFIKDQYEFYAYFSKKYLKISLGS